jgi:hypothetical protein
MAVQQSIQHAVASESAVFDGFGGGIVRKARNRPAGTIHAVDPSEGTACGLPLDRLHVFSALTFERSDHALRCAACTLAVRVTGIHRH